MSQIASLNTFMLLALLWLPLSFFFWFLWAGLLVAPAGLAAEALLTGLWPEHFHALAQQGFQFEIEVLVQLPAELERLGQGQPVVAIPVNPMIYGYGLPLLAGLVASTPAGGWARLAQLLIGYCAIIGVQVWGVAWETFKTLQFALGDAGTATMAAIGIGPNATALAYQFGYLILPAVTPAALWILMNRRFIEALVPALKRA